MEQTPAHEQHNPDLLKLVPADAKKIIEVGCSSGALAREFKGLSPNSDYLGIEIDPHYADMAERYCDTVLTMNIEDADASFYTKNAQRDCWIFGDTLEHLKDPWVILKAIRQVIPKNGCIVICLPNAQHWSLQVKLSVGDWRYEESGLLDKTHLRWFTRATMLEMFDATGFKFDTGFPRIFHEPNREKFLPIIEQMAGSAGADPKIAVSDALPLQYVLRVIPG